MAFNSFMGSFLILLEKSDLAWILFCIVSVYCGHSNAYTVPLLDTNLGRLLPISKRVSFNCYLELVLILIRHLERIRILFFRNFNMYYLYMGFVYCNTE
jgi:hypothetical protein